jgi:hypothetical protein
VNQYKQQEAIDTIPWPAMSPDTNPQCQNLAELRTAIVEEWQTFPQYKVVLKNY